MGAQDKAKSLKRADPLSATWPQTYRYYVLVVLTLVYLLKIADRQILVVLQESIKKELGFSDTELGVLTGLSFAVFYTFLGIPIARLADRQSRKRIIVASIALWSVMTAACGTVSRYAHLLLARIGVGVGSAGGTPPSISILSDLFPQAKRATPLAIYALGTSLGTFTGMTMGGWLNQHHGWRVALIAFGVPGVLMAALVWLTVREPPRGMADGLEPETSPIPLKQAFKEMWAAKAFREMALATAFIGMGTFGIYHWCPPFYQRVHHMESDEVGLWVGLIAGVGGGLGNFLGGVLADRMGRLNARWYLVVPLVAAMIGVPLRLGGFLTDSENLSLWLVGLSWIVASMWYPPIISLSQGLVSPRMRALAVAVVLFILNLVGMGLGPTLAGMLSDGLSPGYGADSIRYALSIMLVVYPVAAVFLWRASRGVREGLEKHKGP